ncbi:MAG: amino acid aminotransferase [Planctomycetota bacterium]
MSATASTPSQSHFSVVSAAPPDAILGLTEAFNADSNPQKMNLSVGVYKDADGTTPILRCVKEAERRLVEAEVTKGYLPIDGGGDYREHIAELVFSGIDRDRLTIAHSPGGTGGLRNAAAFLANCLNGTRVWLPGPTWANHNAIFGAENLPIETYAYLGTDKRSFVFEDMINDLKTKTNVGDTVVLHACCHNPTGVDPTPEQWALIAETVALKGLLPLIDFAYQGFGDGIEEDAVGLRAVLAACDEAIVCNSFSKNFGLYSERVGGVSIMSAGSATRDVVQSQLKRLVRSNYSNPPRHGGAVVATILDDSDLRSQWMSELTEMRDRIKSLRRQFVDTMKDAGSGHDFEFLLDQKGMFSFSGLTPMQVDELRTKYSIYIVGSGRINVAGMTENKMDYLCDCIAKVMEA